MMSNHQGRDLAIVGYLTTVLEIGLQNIMSESLKQKLKLNNITIGSWITLGHPAVSEIFAKAGFDWLAVDLEHSVIDLFEAESLIRVIGLHGIAPLVRLSANDPIQIKRVMDAGAHGVIVPMVNSVVEARQAVEAVYYPTRGKRGVGLARAQGYGNNFSAYKEWLEDNAVVIVQVEHIDSARNLEGILATPGVDGLILGPYDLSASMGRPGMFEDDDVQKVIRDVLDKARQMGKPAGIHVIEPNPDELSARISEGFCFIAYSLDIRMLDVTARRGMKMAENVLSEKKLGDVS